MTTIDVTRTISGFRLTFEHNGHPQHLSYSRRDMGDRDWWDNACAAIAKNDLQSLYGMQRKNIRFNHVN